MAYLKIRPDLLEKEDTTKEASNIETTTMHIAFLTLDRLVSYEIVVNSDIMEEVTNFLAGGGGGVNSTP